MGLFHEVGHEEMSKVALECKADIIVVENETILKKVLLIQHKLPDLRAIVQLMGDPPLSDKRRLHKSHKVILKKTSFSNSENDFVKLGYQFKHFLGGRNCEFPMI